jgi:ubiquinone/menaquinone biosynthesis C-methylase UbiE
MSSSSVTSPWSNPERFAAIQRYRRQSAAMGRAATGLIVELAAVRPGMRVLDVATGTGEPALSLAPLLDPLGEVIGIDTSAEALETARQRAEERHLRNARFQQADVHNLPFAEGDFDVITSRLGIMFFTDLGRALEEMRRVLCPGGHIVLLAWGAMEQSHYFSTTLGTILKAVPGSCLPPQGEAVFKFADPGTLSLAMRAASFRDVREESRAIPWAWPGTPEELWDYFRTAIVPFRPLLDSIPPDRRLAVDTKVLAAIHQHYDGKQVNFESRFVVVTAVK